MREVQSSDAKTHLPQLLDEVERGETIIITRHGRPVARIVPESQGREAEIRRAQALIREFRQTMPKLTLEEILSARHEGHKY
ncbi:type II toxin-antitoxin system Phd/YefM family antitoxin [Nitrospirillum amazonense]|uniref:Antitoxin n=1 Tax=Nitrospirillum amazonense TaxID=28077 RepID=A0A560JD35_9PROT|nr:type II toxin-antitoxin system prevent-host-death family antitoxin [Nitrospirillum amazonense]MDG3442516.1 type II toxin-antitoxin system prevent-host-death family antitoxin [Nitrospirillum amazonense]TWB68409.1 prevent-host-death family protein [Nitrospirillum amazonense]